MVATRGWSGMIPDEIRTCVRDRYERFPYPGPDDNLDAFRDNGRFTNGCPWHNFH
jgi:hypothetical protein